MNFTESILIAIEAVKAQKLRSGLTLLSIAIGIFAIIGSITAQTSLERTVSSSLEAIGETTFLIKRMPSVQMGNTWRKYRRRKDITYTQAREFQRRMKLTDVIAIQNVTGGIIIKANEFSTDPDVALIGGDENYFLINNMSIREGRPFGGEDVNYNRPVAVIGNDVAVKLFPYGSPIGQTITVQNQKFTVIGLIEAKGAILGQSQDNHIIVPISFFMKYFASEWDESVDIAVKAESRALLSPTVDEAIGVMRTLRNVKPWEENTFEIETSESLAQQFSGFTAFLGFFGIAAGLFALVSAGIGIMNIMLISVKERTREIGIRKAIGARRSWIVSQFLIEAATLCLIGGILGIIFGIAGAGLLSYAINTEFSLPLLAVFGSVLVCLLIGLVFGSYPAWKAAKLDPIEALRYE